MSPGSSEACFPRRECSKKLDCFWNLVFLCRYLTNLAQHNRLCSHTIVITSKAQCNGNGSINDKVLCILYINFKAHKYMIY
jgi:hypothetical protein